MSHSEEEWPLYVAVGTNETAIDPISHTVGLFS